MAGHRPLRAGAEAAHLSSPAVGQVAIAVARELDVHAMVEAVVDATMSALGAAVAHVLLADEAKRELALVAHRGLPQDVVERLRRVSFDDALLAADAARTRALAVIESVESLEPRLSIARDVMQRTGCESLIAVPLVEQGRLAGVLTLGIREPGRRSESELATLRTCGELIALGIARSKSIVRERDLREQLDLERARLRAVLMSAPHGIFFVDAVTREASTNPRGAELLGQELRPGQTLADYRGQICEPDGTPIAEQDLPVVRALHGERFSGAERMVRRPDGSELPIFSAAGPVVGEDGALLGSIAVFDDITPLKELERLREDWAAIVAHDLRQPLSLIVTSLRVLRDALDPCRVSEYSKVALGHCEVAVRNLARMVDDLLDASLLEARRISLETRPLDVQALVREVVDRIAIAGGARVGITVQGPAPVLAIDPTRLEQILGNLLGNAAKHAIADTPIEVVVEARDHEVEIAVSNEGSAIPPDEIPHVFERYFRTRGARGALRGSGLGLYITKGLVEAHGGRIEVESRGGRTTFRFTLPVTEVQKTPTAEA